MNYLKFNLYKAAAISAVALYSIPSGAMPALPRPICVDDGRGGKKEIVVIGDEFLHNLVSPDMKIRYERDADGLLVEAGPFDASLFNSRHASKRAPERLKENPNFPCYGQQRAIAVLVEFPSTDKHPDGRMFGSEDPRGLFSEMLNSESYSHDGATGSVRDYFLDSSNGTLDLTFDVYGPVMMSKDVVDYRDAENTWEMVVEACRHIDDEVDFTIYDRDADGIIDNVYIFYAGSGAATGGDPSECIWQHASDVELLSGMQFEFDGVRLNHYACSNEYREVRNAATGAMSRQTEGIGTVCHEFSHVLGLPDLYDVYYSGNTSPGIWDVMDTGCHLNDSRTPAAYSALDRMLLGWLEPEQIGDSPKSLTLVPIGNNKAYMIPTQDPDEFFLLENRQQKGWDSCLPGHGMLLWRINYKKDFWDANQVNTGKGYSHAIIVPADGRFNSETYDGDPFPGNGNVRNISDDGFPNMLSSRGERSNAPISSINEAGGIISFDICKAITRLDRVEGLRATEVTPTSFIAQWDQLPMSPGYEVSVFAADGSPVGIYNRLSVATSSLTVNGLEPETEYHFIVCGVAGKVRGDESAPCYVTTPGLSFPFTAPEGLIAVQTDANFCRVEWNPLAEAADYSLSVFTTMQGEDRYASVNFKGGIEALPAGWQTNAVSTMSISGYYGAEAPSLSMTTDYGKLQSPIFPSEVKELEFWYRERNPSGKNAILIEALAEGIWSQADRIELPSSMGSGVTYLIGADLLPEGTTAVRIIYNREEKGSLALDDIIVTYLGEPEQTAVEGFDAVVLGNPATSTLVGPLQQDIDYSINIRGINANGELSAFSRPVEIRLTAEGSVSTADADYGPTDYFDLYGRCIDPGKAEAGIYIRICGGSAKKIMIK